MRRLVRLLGLISILAPIVNAQADGERQAQMIIINEDGQQTVPIRTHTLVAPYLESDLQSRWCGFFMS